MSISGIYALTGTSNTGKSFSTSAVNIEIKEFMLNNENEEVEFASNKPIQVMPGEEVPLIAKINNLGASCYVRVKAILQMNNEDISSNIQGISDEWKKQGEYYYYNTELNSNSIAEIFKSIKIPDHISNIEDEISLKIVAEAVQSKNFNQDLSLEDPWNGVEIEESVDNSYIIDNDEKTNKMTIKYENNANADIKVSEKFLGDFSKILPGDTISENVAIKNTSDSKAKYYVSLEKEEYSDMEEELLKKLTLKITNRSGKVIYEGNLLNINEILLGEYASGEEDNLIFEINVPSELNNDYAILNPNIIWKFTATYEDIQKETNNDIENATNDNNKNKKIEKSKNPRTGDFGLDLSLTLFFLSTLGLIVVLILEYREKRMQK